MSFELELSKGEFTIPKCSTCKKIIWPPMEFCNYCFGTVYLKRGDFEGKIITFSRHNEEYFCVVEFEKTVRIIAKISKVPKNGQTVRISKCGISKGDYYFYVN